MPAAGRARRPFETYLLLGLAAVTSLTLLQNVVPYRSWLFSRHLDHGSNGVSMDSNVPRTVLPHLARWVRSHRGHRVVAALALVALLPALRAQAEPRLYVIDPGRSQIRFHAAARFSTAYGAFGRFDGEIRVEDGRPEAASARVTVDVASIYTGIWMRDNHLRSRDFFDVARYREATFTATTLHRDGDHLTVDGDLTIRGVTRPITVPVTVTVSPEAIRVAGELTVDRRYQNWLNPIRDEVRLWFDLTAVPR